jgi:acetylornithine/succinyldiaminopimelate/putrescine aminotransferase
VNAQPPDPNRVILQSPSLSLVDLLGEDYLHAVCGARAFLSGDDPGELWAAATQPVDFFPVSFRQRLDELLPNVGQPVCAPLANPAPGAGTLSFRQASRIHAAPLSALGPYRVGEDGRLYLTAKSEHYHTPLGHEFPGYRLLDQARRLGIPNATHNNTRGFITRRLEQELVRAANRQVANNGRAANGLSTTDTAGLQQALSSTAPHVLNRVINLETGSLAVEAALKMMLARFYRYQAADPAPRYAGRTPVFLVVGDCEGELEANYHGTTLSLQWMRGLWPELSEHLEHSGALRIEPVPANDAAALAGLIERYERPPYKIAGFLHEIVLMNYGAVCLEKSFLQKAYALCQAHDVPVLVDEVQSGAWSEQVFLFREYGLQPDFVALGKGFPNGEFPASRVLATAEMDSLPQFGALVTNGQEELASLAYLITMAFIEDNRGYVAALGEYYQRGLQGLAGRHPETISGVNGYRHLAALCFQRSEQAVEFCRRLNQAGIDVSVQTYKPSCPPAALTKLPLITSYKMIDFLLERMEATLT